MKRLLYVGCLGYQNMGDEACLDGARALLEPALPKDWGFHWINGYDFKGSEPFDALVLGGGTLLSPHGNLGDAALLEARRRKTPYYLFGTGLESIEWEGLPEDPAISDFVKMVNGARLIGVRGPRSKDYLIEIGIPADRVRVVGDPAVMLRGSKSGPLDRNFSDGRWLGVNIGTSFGHVWGWDEEHICEMIVQALTRIAEHGWSICLLPIWPRDLEIQQSVANRLTNIPNLICIDVVRQPEQIIDQMRQLDAAIAMKLHAGIFSAIAGTPYIPLAYRPKVEDFAAAIGVEKYAVRTDRTTKDLLISWDRLLQDPASLRAHLKSEITQMRNRLEKFTTEIVQDLKRNSIATSKKQCSRAS